MTVQSKVPAEIRIVATRRPVILEILQRNPVHLAIKVGRNAIAHTVAVGIVNEGAVQGGQSVIHKLQVAGELFLGTENRAIRLRVVDRRFQSKIHIGNSLVRCHQERRPGLGKLTYIVFRPIDCPMAHRRFCRRQEL